MKVSGEYMNNNTKTATFGGGCFWCIEAVFQSLEGVGCVVSGYAGGHIENPGYKEVSQGTTGHAEVVQIHYSPDNLTFDDLLDVFFKAHDPTTLYRQGNDIGTQYRSVIFYHNEIQKTKAEGFISHLDNIGQFNKKIVTEVIPFNAFYKAEEYHQNYYENNTSQPYCQHIIKPKVKKIKKYFPNKLKVG
jgi:peptide-methionine (S)-S-oxide reductase